MNNKKLLLIIGIILALVIIIGLAFWKVTLDSKKEETPVSTPSPTSEIERPIVEPDVLPEDAYSKDFENGTPWWNAEKKNGERSYAGTTMLAFTENGVYAYVFGQDKTLPPEHSDPVYLGTTLNSSLYDTSGFEDMAREFNGVKYVIANGWLDLGAINFEDSGAQYEWITANFSRAPLTVNYLRSEPWKSNLESSTGIDLSDAWWDGKIVAQEYKIECPNGTVSARLNLGPGHNWIINEKSIPEEMLLKDGCTIKE